MSNDKKEMMKIQGDRYINLDDHDGRRIDRAMKSLFPFLPNSAVYRLLRKGGVKLNRKKTAVSDMVKSGDVLHIFANLHKLKEESQDKGHIPKVNVDILLEDANIIIVNKSSNISVHKGTHHEFGLIERMQASMDKPLFPVHRLDKTTSGCLAIAKNPKTALKFQDALARNKVVKLYSAIALGRVSLPNKRISLPIDGKASVSFVKNLYYLNNFTVITLQSETGRKHQIRRHLQMLGHPIVGDKKYGSSYKANRIFLHASELRFQIGTVNYHCTAPLDKEWINFVRKISTKSITRNVARNMASTSIKRSRINKTKKRI